MTLLQLKMKKAELRNRMDIERKEGNLCIQPETFIEYQDVIRALKWAESRLLRPIVISLLMVLFILGGCAKVMQGTGLIFEGVGDGVVAGGQHLQESSSNR